MLVVLSVACCQISLFAQKKKTVEAEGTWEMHGDITPNQAKEKALFEAKKNALAKVGENVNSISLLTTSSDQQQFTEDFSELTTISVDGKVRLLNEPDYAETRSNINGMRVMKASIKAEVMMDDRFDPEFVLNVKDLQNVYRHNDELSFSVELFKDAYVRIFWFDNTLEGKGDIIYPFPNFDKDSLLPQGKHIFPINKMLAYTVEKKNTEKTEKSILIIVATKRQIPFINEVNYYNFFKWYQQIAGDERTNIYCHGFLIYD
ncbi:MAG: hypothetical protein PHR53_02580 [Bacteroidales bacterium]|nr:hypothetical protein [Bacteroidales bacterium]